MKLENYFHFGKIKVIMRKSNLYRPWGLFKIK